MQEPLVAPVPQATCSRCGTFMSGPALTLEESGGVCEACVAVMAREVRLWPSAYVVTLGVLLNFVTAAVLTGLNWRRLGQKKQARMMWGVVGVGLLVNTVLLVADTRVGMGLGVNTAVTIALTRPWAATWEKLRARGFQRANLWLPVIIAVVASLTFAVLVLWPTGQLDDVSDAP